MRKGILAVALVALAATASEPIRATVTTTAVFVELTQPEPVVVARWKAERQGRPFDVAAHRASIRASQDAFLQKLAVAGITGSLTQTGLLTGTQTLPVEDRFLELINAVRLNVVGTDVIRIRKLPEVRHVSLDTPRFLLLDHSVAYIRANGSDSARTDGFRGTGTLNPDGSATGQVIAYLDTGIDQTHPMFDTTKDDAHFEDRLGDTRLPRLGGQSYVPGTNHPKVAYRVEFSTQPVIGDDVGHGTEGSSAAAGLKVRRQPGGEILEGVAPGALLMDYKVCPSLACEETLILQSLEDAVREADSAGNPKPVATVVNMSFGSCEGDPQAADAIAAGNLQYAGVVPMASAGNLDLVREVNCDDHIENTIGSPSAGRLVVSIGASIDPGTSSNSLHVLEPSSSLHDSIVPAGDPASLPRLANQTAIQATQAPESQSVLGTVAQYYVYVGFADTPDDVPAEVTGRICLSERGGDVDAGATGSGLFANKATQCTARGGIALVVFNNVPGQIGAVTAPAAIPVLTISREDGLILRDTLGFESVAFGALSRYPIRINPVDPDAFQPDTAGFSSRGPNNDFATVKPDFLAPGENILMATAVAGDPTRYTVASGTSFSCPHASGTAALVRDPDVGRPDFTSSMVRAALMNSATNVRLADNVTPVPDDDKRVFLHATGAGLADLIRATRVGTLIGTNELNGTGGPDDITDPDFLPSYSFGELVLIGTGRPSTDAPQRRTVTVTIADVGGGGGTYTLQLVDAGALRGDITRPIDTPGFSVVLNPASVSLPPGGRATFDMAIAVDGQPEGLQIAGADDDGLEGTDIAWYVLASRPGEDLRMPFYFRGARGAGNQPPVARDDTASTLKDHAVTVPVLANDSDPEGQPLSLASVGAPAHGSATANADGTVTYRPVSGFLGTDAFTYRASDGSLQDEATVTVQVESCPPSTDGVFTDDFEPAAEPGWTVQSAVAPTGSITWSLRSDPLAHSPTRSYFSDAAVPVGAKDDRLIAPPQNLSASSRLIFWHRFSFESGFDGGVIEVSRDGGATWVDVVAGGGSFVTGGYNGLLSSGNRPAWTGASSPTGMSRVEVNLGAYAGTGLRVRWRLTQDDNTGSLGWWLDDVQFTNLVRPATSCNLPPDAVDDHAATTRDTPVSVSVLANDSDPEGGALTVQSVTQPQHGAAQIDSGRAVIYTPESGYTGDDLFTYTVSDGQLTDTATVTIEVHLPASPGRSNGGGWIPDGSGKARFEFSAQRAGAESSGKLTYDASQSGIQLEGTVQEASVSGYTADFVGNGTLSDGRSCRFSVHVEDAAEPGKGADRFQIRVTVGGTTVHQLDSLLGGGNVQVKSTH
ncbi:MAG TPA: Ig-like domain-containing protein [Candidatus Polarisedimenticolia bacterium]|jgi:hypothetical protein